MNLELKKPSLSELWFRKQYMQDPDTMSYNSGYEVSYAGYDFDTGCIEFPEKNWETWYKKLNDTDFFYFYIYDKDIDEYVGSVDFHKIKDNEDYIGNNNDKNDYAMGIVIYSKFRNKGYMRPSMKLLIEKAKELNVKKLINAVTVERRNALRVFYELGFKKTDTFSVKKFKKPIDCEKIELTLDK